MAGLIAVVARLIRAVAPTLRAVPGDVPGLITVVARRLIRALCALARYVSRAVASTDITDITYTYYFLSGTC